MIKMNAFAGSGREVVARGVRNSVGMDINPKDGTVWFTDNQTDGMGDDMPPGELNRITKAGGEHFGYPFIHGNDVQIAGTAAAPDLKGMAPPAAWTKPQVNFPAHQAQPQDRVRRLLRALQLALHLLVELGHRLPH